MYNRTDPQAIHETILRDIVDVATDIKDTDELQFVLGKGKSFKSVASASSNLTLVFPCVVEDSMDISTAMMIVKAQERKCVAMVQMLFSAFSINDVDNAMDYVKKFHTNLSIDDDITIDKFVKTLDKIADLDESSGIVVDKDAYALIKEDMRNIGYYLPESTNDMALNNYCYSRLNGGLVTEAKPSGGGPKPGGGKPSSGGPKPASSAPSTPPTASTSSTPKSTKSSGGTTVKVDDRYQQMKNITDIYTKQIHDTDIKKANELMPTLMTVYMTTKDKGEVPIQTAAIVGIKVKLYAASSSDIADRLKAKNRDGNGLNTFIRATTREISFWKDFIFCLDKAKLDALSSSRRGGTSPVWKLLERRALKSRIRRTFRFTNDATAITTLTVSDNTVQFLKKTSNVDLTNERTARQLMEAFNLMSIVIVDEGLECAHFIYDTGDDLYETIPFTALERESSDNTYKRVVSLMSKMR